VNDTIINISTHQEEITNEVVEAHLAEVKEMGIKLCELIEKLASHKKLDQRWVGIGQTNLQQGLMALTRAIAKPGSF